MKRCLALALLLVLPIAAPHAAAQTATDVGIVRVEIAPDPVVNESSTVTAIVRNPSSAQVYVTVDFRYDDGTPLRAEDAGSPVGTSNGRLVPPNTDYPISVSWFPPFERRGEAVLRLTASASGDPDLSNNTAVNRTFIRAPKLNVTLEDPLFNETLPLGETVFRYAVRNDGNWPDHPIVTAYALDGWEARPIEPTRVLAPGETAHGHLLVAARTDNKSMNLTLVVNATSTLRGSLRINDTWNATRVNDTVLAAGRHAFAVEGLAPAVQVAPSETRAIPFLVRNVGRVEDAAYVNVSVPPQSTPWRHNLTVPASGTLFGNNSTDATSMLVALKPGEARIVSVNVTRPAGAGNATIPLYVNVTSVVASLVVAVDPDGAHTLRRSVSLVAAGADLGIVALRSPPTLYEGDQPPFVAHVVNGGRAASLPAKVRFELRDNLRLVDEATLDVAALGPGVHANVSWTPRLADARGAHVLLATLLPNGTDRDAANDRASLNLHVRRPELSLRAPERLDLDPGARLLLSAAEGGLGVRNAGDRAETVEVELASDVPWLKASWVVEIPAQGETTLPLDLEVPRFPHLVHAEATLTARVAARPAYNVTIPLSARVHDDEPPAIEPVPPPARVDVGASVPIAVRADDATGIARAEAVVASPDGTRQLVPLRPDAADATLHRGEYVVRTPGNHTVELRVVEDTADALSSKANVTFTAVDRAYGGLVPANFREGATIRARVLRWTENVSGSTASVQVDTGAGFEALAFPYEARVAYWKDGAHVVRMTATSVHGVAWSRTWNVTLDTAPPTLEEPSASPSPEGGLEVSVRARGASNVTARFETPTGAVDLPLSSRGDGRFGARLDAPASWSSLRLLAADAAGNEASVDVQASDNDAPAPWALLAVAAALAGAALRRRR